ncbi:hypothetical protein OROHE_010257 [Orobanche hederae]
MSTSRGSGVGNGGVVQPIPSGSRKVVESLKEIVNSSEAEIYATLKECNMDPNEAVNRLLCQDPFREVKSKREKKKEGKDNSEPRSRGANHSSNRGGKIGTDRQYGRGASAPYYTSDISLHGKSTYKKENGSVPYTSSLSSVPGASGNNRSRGLSGFSDDVSAESKGSWLETADSMPSIAQTASVYQPAWVGITGQVSMADIVRMGKPNKKGSNAPNASYHDVQDPYLSESLHTDHSSLFHQSEIPTSDEWPVIENPDASNVISVPEHAFDPELHPDASGVSYDNINDQFEDEEIEEEDDNFEGSGGNDVGSVSISSRTIPEDDARCTSLYDTELYKNVGSYQSEAHDFEHHGDVGASVVSVTRNLQQLSVNKDDRGFPSEGNAPSVVIPDHLQVQTADCAHLSFGSFGSGMSAPYSTVTKTSVLEKTNLEKAHNGTDESSAGHPETRHSEYYVDDTLRNAPDGTLLHRNGANVGSYEASTTSQLEELRHETADVAHGNQYHFSSPSTGYTFEDAQRLNAAFNQTTSQMQSLAPFSNVMHSHTSSLPSTLLAANIRPTRESDIQYSPFSVSAKYGNSVSSIGVSAISMSEALKTAGLSPGQPAPQTLSGTNVATGPPLPQHLAVHPYSQPTHPLAPYANMISYPFLPQSYTYMPSAFQQSFAGSNNYHQSLAAVLPQYKSSASVSSLPPQSAGVASGYGAFGSGTTVPGNYSMNPPNNAAPSGASLSYDDVLSSQYKDASHLLSLQQNENSATWLHGPNARTMPAVPASAYYSYQTQNQQPGGFRQVQQQQQQSQSYGNPGYPNFYHSQTGISLDQQQNPRDGSLGGSQSQPKQSQIWPNNY